MQSLSSCSKTQYDNDHCELEEIEKERSLITSTWNDRKKNPLVKFFCPTNLSLLKFFLNDEDEWLLV